MALYVATPQFPYCQPHPYDSSSPYSQWKKKIPVDFTEVLSLALKHTEKANVLRHCP